MHRPLHPGGICGAIQHIACLAGSRMIIQGKLMSLEKFTRGMQADMIHANLSSHAREKPCQGVVLACPPGNLTLNAKRGNLSSECQDLRM